MQSETIGALAAALAKAQGSIKPAAKDNGAKIFGNAEYKYATLAALWESAREALSANGLAVTQTTDFSDGEIILLTTLMHTSGEWVGGVYPVRAMDNKPQSLGSAMTYARRYALSAMLGLTADDDDDGNAASAPPQNKAPVKAQNGGGVPKPPMPAREQPNNTRNDSIEPAGEHGTGNDADDNPFTADEAAALKKLNTIGSKLYGDKWDNKRHEIAKSVSNGRTESSRQLTLTELNVLIEGLEKRQRQAVPA